MEVELLKATDQEGNNGVEENFQTNTDDTRNAMDTTDQPQDEESTEKAQQQEDLARKEAEDVVFICIHGQAFQCKPQVGMPITEFKRTFAHTGGCSLCSKLHTHSGNAEVQGRGDKNGKFACAECGKTFSQNASVDHPITACNDKDKHETNATNVDTNTARQNTKRMNHDLVLRSTRQKKRPQVRQNARMSCQECGKVFTGQRAFDVHMKQHDKEKLNKSKEKDDAQNTSRNEILLQSTIKLPQHEDHASYCQMQLYKCKECPKVFKRLNALYQHQTTHQSTKSQSCTPESKEVFCVKCSKAFSRPDILKKHELLHANVAGKAVKCVLCLETLEDEIVYKAHLTKHLKQNRGHKMKCKVCEKVIKETSTLKRHTQLHNNQGKFPCRFGCNSSFASDTLRENHEDWHCTLGEKLLCAFCGLLFSSKTMMLAHERKFHKESLKHSRKPLKKEFKCQYCGRIFGFLASSRRHELTHTNEKPFKCRFCPKAFRSNFGLICHERIHTKEKPYQCEVCGRAFTQETHLKRHMRVHTGEKPYQCQKCGRSYSHDTSLAVHLKNHDDPRKRRGRPRGRGPNKFPKTHENKLECQYCGRLFNHRNCLISHERIHTKEKPYKCTFCGKAFTQRAHCKGHMRIHTGEKPHKCRICGKAFAISGNCRAHEKIHDKSPKNTSRSPKNSAGTLAQKGKNPETIPKKMTRVVYQELSEGAILTQEGQVQEAIEGDGVKHSMILQDPEHELQAADVILQLLESGGRVANLESLVQDLSSQ